jgi:hypothetical protein
MDSNSSRPCRLEQNQGPDRVSEAAQRLRDRVEADLRVGERMLQGWTWEAARVERDLEARRRGGGSRWLLGRCVGGSGFGGGWGRC